MTCTPGINCGGMYDACATGPYGETMPTDLPEPPKPNPIAVGLARLAEYATTAVLYLWVCAVISWVIMMALDIMEDSQPAVPAFGFMFIWAALAASGLLGLFAAILVRVAMKEDE